MEINLDCEVFSINWSKSEVFLKTFLINCAWDRERNKDLDKGQRNLKTNRKIERHTCE